MLSEDKIMEVLEAFDLTRSYRAAAQLCGVDHHSLRRYVAARDAGLDPTSIGRAERSSLSDLFIEKIEQWVADSEGHIRADVVHDKLVSLGYQASQRTTRRVVKAVKTTWRREHGRVYQPWIPEPGLWLQWDYGDGPVVGGRKTVLFCAWLAWSRFRVVLALPDRTLPSVISAWDRTFRILGGAPTYLVRQREDRHHASRGPHPRAQPRHRLGRGLLRGCRAHLCGRGSGIERWRGVDRPPRQGRRAPDRGQPPSGLRDLRR